MLEQLPHDALVVVADGRKAILLRKEGGGSGLSLREESRLSPENLLDDGPSGSRPEEQTSQQTDEATFAKQLAEALYKMQHRGLFSRLVLVADPQTLGQLRDTTHNSVEASIASTLDKELTNHSVPEITAALKP